MNGDYMKLCSVKIIAKCARYSERRFEWTGKVKYGSSLIDLLKHIYETDENFTKEYYDFSKERMKPYHLLCVNDEMLRNDDLKKYLILSDIEIKVVPFVSGG